METVLGIALSFPLVLFTLLLPLVVLYWLLVAVRLLPVELFERDSLKGDHLASTMVSLGFAGVPATVAITALLVMAGSFTLVIELVALRWMSLGLFRVPVGVLVLWMTFVAASPVAEAFCRRLHGWFHRHPAAAHRCQLGETVRVTENPDSGEYATAIFVDDPASEVRLHGKPGARPQVGERRVLVKYLADEEAYRSVLESDYLDARAYLSHLRLMQKNKGQDDTAHNGGSAT
ncbi:hypothetical protein [Aidingimonas lacisalsi]|uniref:hypothetical protein n=1 Tax=Aidingimonas lacisalsi TaxID=2604086 RepID=UPI0011D212A2|nr:hypothetical protein [Aidingimonas lacisalsi]